MGSLSHPRGRLPGRVYWTRRLVVLAVALLLVFGIGRLLGGTGSDDPDAAVKANNDSAADTGSSTSPTTSYGPVAPSKAPKLKNTLPLAAPDGECKADEVSVLPSVPRPYGGQKILIVLRLQGIQPACTFTVSPESLVVKIASGTDRIWSSQDCPAAITEREVVVRSAATTVVPVVWSGRRSDDDCPGQLAWALPGFYHVYAAAYGSTPADVQFEVTQAPTRVVTRTPRPKVSTTATPRPSATVTPKASPKPSPSTSSTVKGKQSKCGGDIAAGSC
jgi:hypothetical protein